ncbi:HlyD family efflux transporter periplasmic adaptor subunit [Marinilabiliaceae bacterium JC017]|nr:HlyD family efflux transporter periplasmic adaptor subunit [Marinilabiliaceae bacterium JC017]
MSIKDRLKITSEEADNIDLRSSEVKEIMGQVPNKIIRYGIGLIAVVLTGILVFSCFFRYPDIITGGFFLQTANPPAFLVARTSGKIQALFVSDKDSVSKNDLLAIIENPVSFSDYQKIKNLITRNWDFSAENEITHTYFETHLDLGELQPSYAGFVKAFADYRAFLNIKYYPERKKSVTKQINDLHSHIRLLQQQVKSARLNYQIAQREFARDSFLFQDKTIALVDYENSQKKRVAQKMDLTGMEITLSSTRMTLTELQQQLNELGLLEIKEREQHISQARQSFEKFKGALSQWENKYCLISPLDGYIATSGIWEVNQNVTIGQQVMTVIPEHTSQVIGKIMIPVHRAGKLKVRQPVNLKFSDFPYQEYGMVVCHLAAISSVPDSTYTCTVILPDSLKTNYGKLLPFRQNMRGTAEIITEDMSLMERFIYPFRSIYKQHLARD